MTNDSKMIFGFYHKSELIRYLSTCDDENLNPGDRGEYESSPPAVNPRIFFAPAWLCLYRRSDNHVPAESGRFHDKGNISEDC